MDAAKSTNISSLGVVHLDRLYANHIAARNGTPVEKTERDWRFDNIVLSGLGLPLESTVNYLLQTAPTFSAFENWILEKNGGSIDPLRIERINCALTGKPYPAEIEKHLVEIDHADDVLSPADLDLWEKYGYVIVREAVSRKQAKASEAAVWEFLGISRDEPNTWYERPIGLGIMMDLYHHPTLAENRTSPRIHKAYAQLWKTADLWVTTDRTSFNPPECERYSFQGPRLHWDMSLAPPYYFGTQGLLYLCDTEADQGAFVCVPGFHNEIEAWLAGLPAGANPREVDLDHLALPIAARAGDFVIWHQALPHGCSPNRGNYPRIVQYMNMFPLDQKENLNWA